MPGQPKPSAEQNEEKLTKLEKDVHEKYDALQQATENYHTAHQAFKQSSQGLSYDEYSKLPQYKNLKYLENEAIRSANDYQGALKRQIEFLDPFMDEHDMANLTTERSHGLLYESLSKIWGSKE